MTISYPLSLPNNVNASSFRTSIDTIVGISSSPFTFQQNVQLYDGERWRIDIALPPLSIEQAGDWLAFFGALRGASGSFYAPVDTIKTTPLGVATGTPLVNGTNNAGSKTLNTKGWTSSITNILKAGDYLQIGTSVYMVLQSVDSDGSGNATLDIFPQLRATLSNNTPIITENPVTVFRLDNNSIDWGIDRNKTYSVSFSGVELL